MSDLQKWFAEYAELMYPTEQQAAGKSQHELDGMVHTARVHACWIVDRLLDTGAHRGLS